MLGELGVFRQKTVAGMNGVHVADFRSTNNAIGPQIAVRALRPANADGFVSELDVQRLHVRFGVNGQRLDAQFATGADNAKGDFTAVGDEDFLNHVGKRKEPAKTTER